MTMSSEVVENIGHCNAGHCPEDRALNKDLSFSLHKQERIDFEISIKFCHREISRVKENFSAVGDEFFQYLPRFGGAEMQ